MLVFRTCLTLGWSAVPCSPKLDCRSFTSFYVAWLQGTSMCHVLRSEFQKNSQQRVLFEHAQLKLYMWFEDSWGRYNHLTVTWLDFCECAPFSFSSGLAWSRSGPLCSALNCRLELFNSCIRGLNPGHSTHLRASRSVRHLLLSIMHQDAMLNVLMMYIN